MHSKGLWVEHIITENTEFSCSAPLLEVVIAPKMKWVLHIHDITPDTHDTITGAVGNCCLNSSA